MLPGSPALLAAAEGRGDFGRNDILIRPATYDVEHTAASTGQNDLFKPPAQSASLNLRRTLLALGSRSYMADNGVVNPVAGAAAYRIS